MTSRDHHVIERSKSRDHHVIKRSRSKGHVIKRSRSKGHVMTSRDHHVNEMSKSREHHVIERSRSKGHVMTSRDHHVIERSKSRDRKVKVKRSKDNWEQHLHHLELVFERLRIYNLTCSVEKCRFGMERLEYLGFQVSSTDTRDKLTRWALLLQEFSFKVIHCPGKSKELPDVLSRNPDINEQEKSFVPDEDRLLPPDDTPYAYIIELNSCV
ncbi:unnamed protein product [Trichogramma brassicae]|uniref:Uncharacterized protein n=1 Tax=Trichogramma brassicae TaxID=86971 RepID=A0A6H5HRV1_9HYME|nr:unnamed protein product [Trichogramma brassicae]